MTVLFLFFKKARQLSYDSHISEICKSVDQYHDFFCWGDSKITGNEGSISRERMNR